MFAASAWLHAAARIATCSLLLGSTGVHAMWAALDDETLVGSSDLIVVGEWQEVSPAAAEENLQGRIVVSAVLKGRHGKTPIRIMHSPGKGLRSGNDLVFRTGDQGLWLLRRAPGHEGAYLIDHPQRFVSAAGGEQRIRALKQLIRP